MKLIELLNDLTWNEIEKALVKEYKVSEKNLVLYNETFLHLSTLEPSETKMRICITWVPPNKDFDEEEGYWTVDGKDGTLVKESEDFEFFKDHCTDEVANSETSWAIEFRPWSEWLGMEIDSETANNIKLMKADIVACCLWEMTFCGYDEEEIKEQADEIKRRCDEIDNMTEEEKKVKLIPIDEAMKQIKEKIKKKSVRYKKRKKPNEKS